MQSTTQKTNDWPQVNSCAPEVFLFTNQLLRQGFLIVKSKYILQKFPLVIELSQSSFSIVTIIKILTMGNTMGVLFTPPEHLSSHPVYGIYDWVCLCLFFFFINLSIGFYSFWWRHVIFWLYLFEMCYFSQIYRSIKIDFVPTTLPVFKKGRKTIKI